MCTGSIVSHGQDRSPSETVRRSRSSGTCVALRLGMALVQELLAVDHRRVLEFFRHRAPRRLRRRSRPPGAFSTTPASSRTMPRSRPKQASSCRHLPASPTCLTTSSMEVAGASCLLLAGFFESQMCRPHSIRWYAELGAGYFSRPADRVESHAKTLLLEKMVRRFEECRQHHARLSRELRDQAYVLTRPPPPSSI